MSTLLHVMKFCFASSVSQLYNASNDVRNTALQTFLLPDSLLRRLPYGFLNVSGTWNNPTHSSFQHSIACRRARESCKITCPLQHMLLPCRVLGGASTGEGSPGHSLTPSPAAHPSFSQRLQALTEAKQQGRKAEGGGQDRWRPP